MHKDKITLERIETIHPALRIELRNIFDEICRMLTGVAQCRFTQVSRTFKQQNELYAQGRTKAGKIVTNARGGRSYHNYGLAVDIALLIGGKDISWDMLKDYDNDKKSDWMEIVNVFKTRGWEWGGDWKGFKDYPHFQKSFGLTVSELYHQYTAKNFIPGTQYLNL